MEAGTSLRSWQHAFEDGLLTSTTRMSLFFTITVLYTEYYRFSQVQCNVQHDRIAVSRLECARLGSWLRRIRTDFRVCWDMANMRTVPVTYLTSTEYSNTCGCIADGTQSRGLTARTHSGYDH